MKEKIMKVLFEEKVTKTQWVGDMTIILTPKEVGLLREINLAIEALSLKQETLKGKICQRLEKKEYVKHVPLDCINMRGCEKNVHISRIALNMNIMQEEIEGKEA